MALLPRVNGPSHGWKEPVAQATSPIAISSQWQTLELFRGDLPWGWQELTAPDLHHAKPGLMGQQTVSNALETQKAQRTLIANTPSQDGKQWAMHITGKLQ